MATYAVVLCWPYRDIDKTHEAAMLLFESVIKFAAAGVSSRPPYPFELMVVQAADVRGTVAVAFFDESKTRLPLPQTIKSPTGNGTLLGELEHWLEKAAGKEGWDDLESYGPSPHGIDSYWGGARVLKRCYIEASDGAEGTWSGVKKYVTSKFRS